MDARSSPRMTVMESVRAATRSAPPPLVGEGWGGDFPRCVRTATPTPTPNPNPNPNPSPQGGEEHTEFAARLKLPKLSSRQDVLEPRAPRAPGLSSPGLTRRSIPPREKFLRRMMDARVKPAHDRREETRRQTSRGARQHRGAELGVVVIGKGMQRVAGVAVIRGAMITASVRGLSAASLRIFGAVDGPRLV